MWWLLPGPQCAHLKNGWLTVCGPAAQGPYVRVCVLCVCTCVFLHVCPYLTCKNAPLLCFPGRVVPLPPQPPHHSNNTPAAGGSRARRAPPAGKEAMWGLPMKFQLFLSSMFMTQVCCLSRSNLGSLTPVHSQAPFQLPGALCIRCPNTVLLLLLFLKINSVL